MHIECWHEPDTTKSGQYQLDECDCTEPSGNGVEWLEVAAVLLANIGSVSHRRVALHPHSDMFWSLSCPRNSHGRNDCSLILRGEESVVLAKQILACLKAHGDPVLFGDADPIKMGY